MRKLGRSPFPVLVPEWIFLGEENVEDRMEWNGMNMRACVRTCLR